MSNNSRVEILKCNILQKNYKILSNVLSGLENQIIQNELILEFSKSQYMKMLNELVKKLNETYNEIVINILQDVIINDPFHDMNIDNESLLSFTDLKSQSHTDHSDCSDSSNTEINYNHDHDHNHNHNRDDVRDDVRDDARDNAHGTCKGTGISTGTNTIPATKPKPNINLIASQYIAFNDTKLTTNEYLDFQLIEELKTNIFQLQHLTNIEPYINDLIHFNPLQPIKEQIITLGKTTGFESLEHLIFLHTNISDFPKLLSVVKSHNEKSEQLLNLMFNILIPTTHKYTYNPTHTYPAIEISVKRVPSPKIMFINNYCELTVKIYNHHFTINGFVKNDPLNIHIRTSQISNTYLYMQKIAFDSVVKSLVITNQIDEKFGSVYVKNMTIGELAILTPAQFESQITNDYLQFCTLNKMQLPKLIKSFTKDVDESLYNMFNTIKLLLLGNDENTNVASLLFNLLKDKKNSSGSEYIANVIHEQLNYICQMKLKKSSFDVKTEVEKIKGLANTDIDLKKQILMSKNMPDYVKKICLDKIDELKNSSSETYKIKQYVNILVKYPWISDTDDNVFKNVSSDKTKSKEFLKNIEQKMDVQIYGHTIAKNKILQTLAKLITVQGTHVSPIALAGPPGVGKTKFAQCLAECLDIPFVQITLGGQNDGELLHGHGYTYAGAQPGLIVKKMVEAGSARCVMYFDELDKCVSKNGQVNELMSILIHLTDPMTNKSFQDRFFQEITFPLNKVMFIFSFNDVSKIDRILLDRLELIDVESYNIREKMTICNDYLLKQLSEEIGFDYGSVVFDEQILSTIIDDYTFEPGVRGLKRAVENILLKLNIDRIYERGIFENGSNGTNGTSKIIITKQIVNEYLGDAKVNYRTIHSKNAVGVVNGLYATTMCSGGIVPIQLTEYYMGDSNKFILKLTGNQRKIMKESIFYSFTTAINLLTNQGKALFFKRYPNGIHIHTPEASTPKDGPSAGVAFTLGFLSMMLDLKIDREIALTGEIDLYGNVSKIGGVKYKVQGAFKAGVKTVFLPTENTDDVEKVRKDLPEIFDDAHTCLFIDHVLDVARVALIGWDEQKKYIKNID